MRDEYNFICWKKTDFRNEIDLALDKPLNCDEVTLLQIKYILYSSFTAFSVSCFMGGLKEFGIKKLPPINDIRKVLKR